jgi:hypothetical protein
MALSLLSHLFFFLKKMSQQKESTTGKTRENYVHTQSDETKKTIGANLRLLVSRNEKL